MKRICSLAAIFALLLFAACTPIDEETTGDSSENQQGRKPDYKQGSEDTTEPVKLGFNLELSGDAVTFGVSAREGAEIALQEIREAGGILGREVETVFDDNQSKPDAAANVASKLIHQDNVDVLVGAVGSSQSIAMAKTAEDAGVPMVTPASTNPAVTMDADGEVRDYVFRTCFTDDFQGEGIVDFAVNGLGAEKAVIFYDAENDYSVGIYETIKRVAPSLGLAIVTEDAFNKSSESDFRAKLSKFKDHEFDVMIVPGYYNQVGLIANQAREIGITQPLLGGDGFDSEELYNVAGENIVGSYYTNHYAQDDMDPAVQEFISKYKANYGGRVPDSMAILGYDAVKVVADAIKRAGTTDPQTVAEALANTENYKGAAGTISITEKHNALKKLVVLKITEGGKLQWVYTYDPLAEEGTAVGTTDTATENPEHDGTAAEDEAVTDGAATDADDAAPADETSEDATDAAA